MCYLVLKKREYDEKFLKNINKNKLLSVLLEVKLKSCFLIIHILCLRSIILNW